MGSIDRLRDENIELNKLNQTMSTELKMAKKNLAKAEKALEAERQEHKDTLREIQDRLDKRLDESVAIDDRLLSKSYLKIMYSPLFVLATGGFNFILRFCQLRRDMAMS